MTGLYLEAIEACKQAIIKSPDYLLPYITMAASYSSLEQYEKANYAVTEILRVSPKYSIELLVRHDPFEHKADLENLVNALRKAGLPEHSAKDR